MTVNRDSLLGVSVVARATINLPGGVRAGGYYDVDPDSPYVQECLAANYLVLEEDDQATPVSADPSSEQPSSAVQHRPHERFDA